MSKQEFMDLADSLANYRRKQWKKTRKNLPKDSMDLFRGTEHRRRKDVIYVTPSMKKMRCGFLPAVYATVCNQAVFYYWQKPKSVITFIWRRYDQSKICDRPRMRSVDEKRNKGSKWNAKRRSVQKVFKKFDWCQISYKEWKSKKANLHKMTFLKCIPNCRIWFWLFMVVQKKHLNMLSWKDKGLQKAKTIFCRLIPCVEYFLKETAFIRNLAFMKKRIFKSASRIRIA